METWAGDVSSRTAAGGRGVGEWGRHRGESQWGERLGKGLRRGRSSRWAQLVPGNADLN